jgi:hypothetical protein
MALLSSLVHTGIGAIISASLQLIQRVKDQVRQWTDTSCNGVHCCPLPSGYLVPSVDRSGSVHAL